MENTSTLGAGTHGGYATTAVVALRNEPLLTLMRIGRDDPLIRAALGELEACYQTILSLGLMVDQLEKEAGYERIV